jgi:hypothetical protein
MRLKYSGYPKLNAIAEKGGARKARRINPIIPAMKEPIALMPKAGPALPFMAI